MAYKCDYCGRGVQYGETGTHHPGVAGAQWKKRAQKTRKVFKPNLHVARIQVAGDMVKMRLCTKCLRRLKAYGKPEGLNTRLMTDNPTA